MMAPKEWQDIRIAACTLLMFFLTTLHEASGQKILYCQPVSTISSSHYSCESFYFYNYLKNSKDSVQIPVLENGEVKFGLALLTIIADSSFMKDRTGIVKVVFPSGKRKDYLSFKEGVLNGRCWSEESDRILGEVNFINGKKNGLQVVRKAKLGIEKIDEYKDGLLNGASFTRRLDTGIKITFQNYVNGTKAGLYFSLHENGVLQTSLLYVNGFVKDGEYLSFDSFGKLKARRFYESGVLVKNVRMESSVNK